MATRKAPPKAVTVFDVAAHAGVSTATVSRALSGTRPMSKDLREKVQASADALGYRVNLVGRALRQQKTQTVGLVIPDFENPFFSSLAQQISRSFSATQVEVLVASADNDIDHERRAVQSFLGRQVDGCVLVPSDERDSAEAVLLASRSVPTVQFDRRVPGVKVPFIGVDNTAGMELVSDHLRRSVDTKKQPVVYVGGGESTSSGRERTASFLAFRPDAWHLEGTFSFDWGQEAAQQILQSGRKTGTIVVAADIIALGVISWLTTSGVKIPDDFRIIGFDDVGVSYLAHPTLSTVRQPIAEMTAAIHALIEPGRPKRVRNGERLYKPEWVARDSSPE
jgi:LacI family transcriptional regulator